MSYEQDYDDTISELDDYQSDLDTLFNKLDGAIASNLDTSDALDSQAAQQEIDNMIREIGFYAFVALIINTAFAGIVERNAKTVSTVEGVSAAFTGEQLTALDLAKELNIADWNGLTDNAVRSISKNVLNYRTGTLSRNAAIQAIQGEVKTMSSYARTWLDTAYAGYHRKTLTMLAVNAGIKQYLYIGPLDKKTRKFCRGVLGQKHTLDQWDKIGEQSGLHPGPLPVRDFCGGWNCRHSLQPVKS